MKKKLTLIITFIIVALVSACKDSSSSNEDIFRGFELMPINFLNKKAYIPANYKKINLNELGEMLRQNPDLNELDKINYNIAASAKNKSGKVPVLYQDSIVNTNSIWFIPGSYIPINKGMVNEFVNMTENSILKPAAQNGVYFNRLEAKFLTRNSLKAIKVKYSMTFENTNRYLTQYIITKNLETYSIVVLHDYNEDFKKILKSL